MRARPRIGDRLVAWADLKRSSYRYSSLMFGASVDIVSDSSDGCCTSFSGVLPGAGFVAHRSVTEKDPASAGLCLFLCPWHSRQCHGTALSRAGGSCNTPCSPARPADIAGLGGPGVGIGFGVSPGLLAWLTSQIRGSSPPRRL